MKKVLALILVLAFSLSACSFGGTKIAEKPQHDGMDYDVIVVGGEPEGVAAAVSAARNGMKTLLIEDDEALGGLMTLGELNFIDMCEGRDGTLLTQGIFKEFYDKVGGTAFDIEKAKAVFLAMVEDEPNLDLLLNTEVTAPILDADTLTGVSVSTDGAEKEYLASVIIDATADADLAAAAGVPYTFAGEDIGEKDRQMGVTLVFTLSGVDWQKVQDYLQNDDNAGTGATDKAAWGYTKEGYAYEPKDTLMRLRGFNIARQDNGNVLLNALIIFGVDVLDEESKQAGIARGQEELAYIVPYLRENCVGFENAELVSTAEQLYVRESRHIIGKYQLTIDDVLENRDCADKIAIGGYPVDVQPTATQTYGTVIGNPDRYAISYGCLVPEKIENLLVVGRSASYKSLAAGSARVIPLGMACGEAAGVAAAYAVNNDIAPSAIYGDEQAIAAIQKTLRAQGAYLEDFDLPEEVMSHWAYSGVKTLRSLGLLDGGYNNDYGLDNELGKWKFQNMFNKTLDKTGIEHKYYEVNDNPTCAEIVAAAADATGCQSTNYAEQIAYLSDLGVIDETL
ncbi:MAG: FAD-dependent oxidoreductase, partial [Clostridiales bacterium]